MAKKEWKNRIVGSGEESLDDIMFNPANWRTHPKSQQEALQGVLDEVGWVQSAGIRLFVDLNISHRHDDLRFVGVPKGWKSYATRAYSDRLNETVKEYEQALEHSEGESILFVCYGGGKAAEELSKKYGWIWYPDQQTSMKEVNYG